MKLVSFYRDEQDKLGFYYDNHIYPLTDVNTGFPDNMELFLYAWEDVIDAAVDYYEKIKEGKVNHARPLDFTEQQIMAPIPRPTSCRDAYAFRQHVEAARKNR